MLAISPQKIMHTNPFVSWNQLPVRLTTVGCYFLRQSQTLRSKQPETQAVPLATSLTYVKANWPDLVM